VSSQVNPYNFPQPKSDIFSVRFNPRGFLNLVIGSNIGYQKILHFSFVIL